MKWSILTPKGSLHWDGDALEEGPPAQRSDAPTGDPMEDLWRKYYASIFNPARLKIGAMLKEMPRKYWKNMPETALVPELIKGAQAREREVEHDERRVLVADALERGRAVVRLEDAEARVVELPAHDRTDRRVVVHHEDDRRARVHRLAHA